MTIFRRQPGDDADDTMLSASLGNFKFKMRFGYLWIALIELIILELALIGGATAVWKHLTVAEDWRVLFVALGASCLGFGAALLLVHHLIERQAKGMADEVASLVESAGTLASNARRWKVMKDRGHSSLG